MSPLALNVLKNAGTNRFKTITIEILCASGMAHISKEKTTESK
jgi:hypothetical protein